MTLGSNTSGHLFDTSFTTNGVLHSAASGVITSTAAGTSGNVLISQGAGSAPIYSSQPVIASGVMTNSSQPCFSAYLSGNAANATGDGTVYKIAFDSEVFDNSSSFNTSTYTFTAPTTGNYLFTASIGTFGMGAAHILQYIQLVTTGQNFIPIYINPYAMQNGTQLYQSFSIICTMTATNTAYLNVGVTGGTKTIGVNGTAGSSYFSGYLIC